MTEQEQPESPQNNARDPKQRAEDGALMARVAENAPEAVQDLYDRFASLVYRMSVQVMPTRPEAEDAVQEVFVRLWKTAARYDSDRAALVTWVMLLTRRHLVDRLRRSKARIRPVSLADGSGAIGAAPDPAGRSMDQEERFGKLMRRVEALPELQRAVVTRAYLGGQTLRQIGEELNTPIGTIKSALSRGLARLRERVGEE